MKEALVRKVLVFGAALAATSFSSLSAVAVPADAQTETRPRPAPGGAGKVVTARAVMVTAPPPLKATYAYGKNSRQRVDAYWRATRAKSRPGVLLLHGGSWSGGNKSSWKYTARKLTTRGYAVFAANYRLTPAYRWPAQRDDAEDALAFIKRNARKWRLDPAKVVVMGSSAGGHLATQLGTYRSGGERVRGVVALSPVNSPYLAYQDGGKVGAEAKRQGLRQSVVSLVGCTPGALDPGCWTRLEDASSATHVTGASAPMLLLHSRDEFVPVTHSTGLASALKAAGVRATVRTVPGAEHGGALLGDERTYRTVAGWLDTVVKG